MEVSLATPPPNKYLVSSYRTAKRGSTKHATPLLSSPSFEMAETKFVGVGIDFGNHTSSSAVWQSAKPIGGSDRAAEVVVDPTTGIRSSASFLSVGTSFVKSDDELLQKYVLREQTKTVSIARQERLPLDSPWSCLALPCLALHRTDSDFEVSSPLSTTAHSPGKPRSERARSTQTSL